MTHQGDDLHQDHRLISEFTYNIFRDHIILEYEILKTDIDLGKPNFFVGISDQQMDKKISILMQSFESQTTKKKWFSEKNLRGLSAIRSVHASNNFNYCEAYYCRKIVL